MKILIQIVITLLLFQSCKTDNNGYKYQFGTFDETPTNFAEINTPFDDYNASVPVLGETFPLVFSSNRNWDGSNFDFIYDLITIRFSKEYGTLNIFKETSTNLDVFIENQNIKDALSVVNSASDELGPYLMHHGRRTGGTNMNSRYDTYVLLYSTDLNGQQDIWFTENLEFEQYSEPIQVDFLNSEFDDVYPCFNDENSEIYFCSNRNTNFDIFKVKTDNSNGIIEILSSATNENISTDTVLSSSFDDKCPYIRKNLLVFASNRDGGFGGFDTI